MKPDALREEIFALKPHFGEVVRLWGDKTVLEYYAQDFSPLYEPSSDILVAIQKETSALLGNEVGGRTYESLQSTKWVNTADHHGLLCHPYFYATALARSHTLIRKDSGVTVTMPFGGVSLGNDSFPRGFFFHDANAKVERIFFKSLKDRRMPVYALLPTTKEELLHERERSHSFELTLHAREQLNCLFEKFLEDERVWNQETYSAQLTLMNSVLWHAFFGESRGEFVYLEIDSVVRRLLIEKHLVTETPIFNLIFESSWREAFVELFSGVFGSHSIGTGTHLFWYIDYVQKTRRGLLVHNDLLVTREGDVVIPLTAEDIAEGLRTRTLMPSTALTLILIHGVEKLACGGGPSQLTYLSLMMERWSTLLARFGQRTDIPATNIYCGDNTLFQIASSAISTISLATCIDLLLYNSSISDTVDTALETTSMGAMVDALLPTLNHLYTKETNQYDSPCTLSNINIQ
ncbi:MAG: hypothetical protein WAW13_02335 [Minisyncoccia bacterium]